MVQNTEIMAPNQDLILPEVNEESSNNNEIFWILFFLAIFSLIVLVMAVSTFLILSILTGASEQVRPVRHVPHQISEAD